MTDQAKNEDIWDVVFQPHKPVHVAFHESMFESDYVFEAKDDHGIFVSRNKKVFFIPWATVDYIAWSIDTESKKEKGEEKKEEGGSNV